MSTEYVVLKQTGPATWHDVGHGSGPSARDAIATSVEDEGTYVAVPARSWNPADLKVETVKRKVWDTNGAPPTTTTTNEETP